MKQPKLSTTASQKTKINTLKNSTEMSLVVSSIFLGRLMFILRSATKEEVPAGKKLLECQVGK